MKIKNQYLLLFSLILNIIFFVFVLVFVFKKGGLSYLSSKFSWSKTSQLQAVSPRPQSQEDFLNRYYRVKTESFRQLPNSHQDIVFVGDSLTDYGEWAETLNNSKIRNRGISGDTTEGVLYRINEIIENNPRKIFIMIGTNDLRHTNKSRDLIVNNYRKILEVFQTRTPNTKVYVLSLLPVNNVIYNNKWDNQEIIDTNYKLQQLAQNFSYQYLDLHSYFADRDNQLKTQYTYDGLHVNGRGYLLWSKAIAPYVNQ